MASLFFWVFLKKRLSYLCLTTRLRGEYAHPWIFIAGMSTAYVLRQRMDSKTGFKKQCQDCALLQKLKAEKDQIPEAIRAPEGYFSCNGEYRAKPVPSTKHPIIFALLIIFWKLFKQLDGFIIFTNKTQISLVTMSVAVFFQSIFLSPNDRPLLQHYLIVRMLINR